LIDQLLPSKNNKRLGYCDISSSVATLTYDVAMICYRSTFSKACHGRLPGQALKK
jgi:hypothetical protein